MARRPGAQEWLECIGARPSQIDCSMRRVPVWLARAVSGQAVTFLTRSHRVDNGAYKSATAWEPAYSSSEDGWARIVEDSQ